MSSRICIIRFDGGELMARLVWNVCLTWLTFVVFAGLIALAMIALRPLAHAQPAFVYSFANITTDTTTALKTGPGFLHNVCVNTPAARARHDL